MMKSQEITEMLERIRYDAMMALTNLLAEDPVTFVRPQELRLKHPFCRYQQRDDHWTVDADTIAGIVAKGYTDAEILISSTTEPNYIQPIPMEELDTDSLVSLLEQLTKENA